MTVSVDAVVYYRVSNPTMATNNIEDYRFALFKWETGRLLNFEKSFQPFHPSPGRHHAEKCPGNKEPGGDSQREGNHQPGT